MAQVITTNTVIYQGNGNTGGTAPVDPGNYVYGIHVVVKDKGNLEREGYRFGGWSRQEGGGGQTYQPGETIVIQDAQIILYAVWKELYTIFFDGNGNTDGNPPDSLQGISGESFVIPANQDNFTREDYRFMGWSLNMNIVNPEIMTDNISITNDDIILYAVWSKLYTVSFNCNGHTGEISPQAVVGITGQEISMFVTIKESGFSLVGWNSHQDATGTAYFSDIYVTTPFFNIYKTNIIIGNEDIVLYAIWSEFSFNDGEITGYLGNSTNIEIPSAINTKSVTSIGHQAFKGCTSLTSVTFEGVITSGDFSDWFAFSGDLRDKFYATNKDNGTPGIYTTTAPVGNNSVWTKQ